jgi:hypothetical protein
VRITVATMSITPPTTTPLIDILFIHPLLAGGH